MFCTICETEFYGVGYHAKNSKLLCRDCLKDVIDSHANVFKSYAAVTA